MNEFSRTGITTALLAALTWFVPTGCGGEEPVGQTARVRITVNALTTQPNTVSLVLSPGLYDFVAIGNAGADSANITLTVIDSQTAEVASVQLDLTLQEANAKPGDSGSGANTGVSVVEGAQSVQIDFRWQGSTPAADLGVDIQLHGNPDQPRSC